VFGGENRRFVVAVRSSQAGVMAPFGEAVIDRPSVCGVVHFPTPFLSCNRRCRALRDTLLQ